MSRYTIIPYVGYGDSGSLRLRGRVLARSRNELRPPRLEDSAWINFKRMARRWFTSQVPHAEIEVTVHIDVGSEELDVRTDKNGYFHADLAVDSRAVEAVWLRLTDPGQGVEEQIRAPFVISCETARFGVVSDIDDTVIASGATRLWTLVKTTLLGNVHTRTVFPGVSKFYAELSEGGRNPLFYITSSPWNLYGFIRELFALHKIPEGPLFMTEWGFDRTKFLKPGHRTHKVAALREIFEFYPDLSWVLLGDSGEKDPEIYAEIAHAFPGRVRAVYIRDVNGTAERAESVAQLRAEGVDLQLCRSTEEARAHALAHGIISPLPPQEPEVAQAAEVG